MDRPFPLRYNLGFARLWDLPQIARLEAALCPDPVNLVQLVRFHFNGQTFFLTARRGRQVVGYMGFQVLGPIAHIITMAIHPRHRHRGVAGELYRAAERVAHYCDARYFLGEVRVSDEARLRFLSDLGWRQLGVCRQFFADGEDALVLFNWLDRRAGAGREAVNSTELEAPGGQDGAPRRQADPVGGRDNEAKRYLDGHGQEQGAQP